MIGLTSYLVGVLLLIQKCLAQIAISDLRVEHLTNPLGIDVETPRFSWKLTDSKFPRGQRQTAYHILVANTAALLDSRNSTDFLWDSGVVVSGQSHLIEYAGRSLVSGQDLYWKVQVYDAQNNTSAWSDAGRFSMGLIHRADWDGVWIKHPTAKPEQHLWFRKKITLDDVVTGTAFAYVSSVGYHELYINGMQVDYRYLAPSLTRLDVRVQYVTYDITALLRKGSNIFAVWYGPGWSRFEFWKDLVDQCILVQIVGETASGTPFRVYTNETWAVAPSYSRNTGSCWYANYGGEFVSGPEYTTQWNTLDFNDTAWPASVVVSPLKNGSEPVLSAQMTEPTRVVENISAILVNETSPGIWRVTLSKNWVGIMEIHFHGLNPGDSVVIEVNDKFADVNNFNQTSSYIARGEDNEAFVNRFNWAAGRYIQLTGLRQAPALADVVGHAFTSVGKPTSTFECSDELFNRIHEIDLWTFMMTTIEGFTYDCPHRERLGYGEGSGFQTLWGVGLPSFDTAALYVADLRHWDDAQETDGFIPQTAPQANPSSYGGPMWGSGCLSKAVEHFNAHADMRMLQRGYRIGERWVGFLSAHVQDGLLTPYVADDPDGGHYLGDWLAPGPVYEYGGSAESEIFNDCVYAMVLDFQIQMAKSLGIGDGETAYPYADMLRVARESTHAKFWNADVSSYLDGSQVRTAFPLYSGIVPAGLREAALQHLEDDMRKAHPYFNVGDPPRYPYFKVLFADPRFREVISDILASTDYPGYGHFIAIGETAWPETWEDEVVRSGKSKIHDCFTGISAWFYKALAGINPDPQNPGYKTVTIQPQVVSRLSYARASIVSPYGRIESGWTRSSDGDGNNSTVTYSISVPIGSNANVLLPAAGHLVLPTGVEVARKTDDGEYLVIPVESGAYTFVITS